MVHAGYISLVPVDESEHLNVLNLALHEHSVSVASEFLWFLVENTSTQFYNSETVEFS